MTKTVAIAADHGGFVLKSQLIEHVQSLGHSVIDLGTNDADTSVDYPEFAAKLANFIITGRASCGILVCGTGVGMSIAANRWPAVRCALVHDVTTARLSREHNDANVLAIGGRVTGVAVALDCVNVFLTTDFSGGRHARRVKQLGDCPLPESGQKNL